MARVIALGPSGSVSVMIDCLFHFADPCFVFRLIKSAFCLALACILLAFLELAAMLADVDALSEPTAELFVRAFKLNVNEQLEIVFSFLGGVQ